MTDDDDDGLYFVPGSKRNDLITLLAQIERRMKENPGMTVEESVAVSGVPMSKYYHAVKLRAYRKKKMRGGR